jgi:hypothetical protein
MVKLKTVFEQVPLEIVRKIIEKELPRQETAKQARGTKNKSKGDPLGASTVNGRDAKS